MLLEEICKNNKYLSNKRGSGLLIFQVQPVNNDDEAADFPTSKSIEQKSWTEELYRTTDKFSSETTIHGVSKWANMNSGKLQRLFWFLAFVAALLTCIYVSIVIANRYNAHTFHTLIETTNFPIYNIPFPEVAICNHNRLNWHRLEAAQQRFLYKEHQEPKFKALFERILTTYDNVTFGTFTNFQALEDEPKEQMIALNYVNFTDVVDFMSWRCSEIFERCTWRTKDFDCCDIFLKRRSQNGQCLAFNSVEGEEGKQKLDNDSNWPWRNSIYGQKSGLTLRVLLREQQHNPNSSIDKGISLMLGEPHVYFSTPTYIVKNTKTTIALEAVMHFYDDETRGVSSSERECVFEDEQNSDDFKSLIGHKYMFENCQSECQQEYLMEFCNCTVDLFYPPSKYPICKLTDLTCLARNNHKMLMIEQPDEKEYVFSNSTGMICKCFLNCYSLTYITDVRSVQLREVNVSSAVIDLDVFFVTDYFFVYKTSLVTTWVDLVASYGGIVGLFLGCSLMSLVELVYFLIFEVPHSVVKYQKEQYEMELKRQKFEGSAKDVLEN